MQLIKTTHGPRTTDQPTHHLSNICGKKLAFLGSSCPAANFGEQQRAQKCKGNEEQHIEQHQHDVGSGKSEQQEGVQCITVKQTEQQPKSQQLLQQQTQHVQQQQQQQHQQQTKQEQLQQQQECSGKLLLENLLDNWDSSNSRSIFFLETSSKETLTAREACALESAARLAITYLFFGVCVLMTVSCFEYMSL